MERTLRTYPAPWEGEIILACRKCQKKLKKHGGLRDLAKLKKAVKRYNKEHADKPLHVVGIPCMDLCPKDGVTVCCPTRDPNLLEIIRSSEDLQKLSGSK
jgi:predicted metal-binding protein